MNNIDDLQDLLDKWNKPGGQKTNQSPEALAILNLAESILKSGEGDPVLWRYYLNTTGRLRFIRSLESREDRYRWSESTFRAIELADYTLLDMFDYSAGLYPDKTLFQDMTGQVPSRWSYQLCAQRIRAFAATFYETHNTPRVAIFSSNCVESALSDLACLFYDILVVPLNVHFDSETIAWILEELDINIVLTDNSDNYQMICRVRENSKREFTVYTFTALDYYKSGDADLSEQALGMVPDKINRVIEDHPRRDIHEVATVMFTSGSTGRPKGISFSIYNLITKRFARAAALPNVGDDEILLCFLPLYHTFGRYFEMLGIIFWGGTYVFPGDPSVETLTRLLAEVNPTGLISIPLRWIQISENCLLEMGKVATSKEKSRKFREVVGKRLHWGLSAAGHLAPKVFRFFNSKGVKICSGFGMTEATGGITMTPPDEYIDNSIGIPLPGIKAEFSDEGELSISGPYVARYLAKAGPGDIIDQHDGSRLATGDLFRELNNGHYEIIDRVKDIYKNNKGQTIAPLKVEQKFAGVPGISRTFLVGDAREYNVLLIVPDTDDSIYRGFRDDEDLYDYYHKIITKANQDLAPFERVVNFALLNRDFDIEKEELTPKGTFRRKTIEENFWPLINELYRSKHVELPLGKFTVRIPRWFYRDLGILEDDIIVHEGGLYDRHHRRHLIIEHNESKSLVRIGDLYYHVKENMIDLGTVCRQPLLWLGNPPLIIFSPVKEGWHLSSYPFTGQVFLPDKAKLSGHLRGDTGGGIADPFLEQVNRSSAIALFGEKEAALEAVEELAVSMRESDDRLRKVIRHRLAALSNHDELKVRALAYRVLLMDDPSPDYTRILPSFIHSGKVFLDEESIHEIASNSINRRRLESLRQRLYGYRIGLKWPADNETRKQFENLLALLTDFSKFHPEFYATIRAELASWILHKEDPELSEKAEKFFTELFEHYETNLDKKSPKFTKEDWRRLLIFDDNLSSSEKERVSKVLVGTTFLKQSIMLAFDEDSFELDQVPDDGIWISRITSRRRYLRYRVSVNTHTGKHFDIQVIFHDDVKKMPVLETIYWLMSIANYPFGPRVVPRLGCCRPELGARSLVYRGELTVWEKIREFSSRRARNMNLPEKPIWRKMFIRGLATIFKGWRVSGKRIIPGRISPETILVPEQDFRQRAMILSLNGWHYYKNPMMLIEPMYRNFILKSHAHYPMTREIIDIDWIFDAAVEDLGLKEGRAFLVELRKYLDRKSKPVINGDFRSKLDKFVERLNSEYYITLPLSNAIDRFRSWAGMNTDATGQAREQLIYELWRLYRLGRYPEIARYYLYRHTYFSNASDETKTAFDKLIDYMFHNSDTPALQTLEISDLQATIDDPEDRRVFSNLIFPKAHKLNKLEVLAVGSSEHKQVVVKTNIVDRNNESFTVREPVTPVEIGQLYRIFFKEGYSKSITEGDRYLVVVDSSEQIIGGMCYRYDGDDVVSLDGSVMSAPLMGRGIGGALLEDFCNRLSNQGIRVVKTHFFLRRFYSKRGFQVDKRWGALVRFLNPGESDTAALAPTEIDSDE